MKELNVKNKFRHKLGPGGYKIAMPNSAKKEQELHEVGIPDPLQGCTVRTRNRVRVVLIQMTVDDWSLQALKLSMWLKKPRLAAKERTGEFKSQQERDQLSAALENEEHRDHTWVISSIASWKDGFVDESHM
jgi:hypothetical protein